MAKWVSSVLLVIAPGVKSITVLAVTSEGSGNCRGRAAAVAGRSSWGLEPAKRRREDLDAVRTLPLMLALITSIQASTAFRDWMELTGLAISAHRVQDAVDVGLVDLDDLGQ